MLIEKEIRVQLPIDGTMDEQVAAVKEVIETMGARTMRDFYYLMKVPNKNYKEGPQSEQLLPVLLEMELRGILERREIKIGTEERIPSWHPLEESGFVSPPPRHDRYRKHRELYAI